MDYVRLLIVDDNIEIRELAAEALANEGYEILTTSDGTEATKLLSEPGLVQALVTDVMLHGWINGGDIVELARLKDPTMPILIISGFSDGLLGRLSGMEPPVGFLPKPFGLAQLSAAMAEVINKTGQSSGITRSAV